MKTYRRTVAILSAPGITAARQVYTTVPADVVRVAALVEICPRCHIAIAHSWP